MTKSAFTGLLLATYLVAGCAPFQPTVMYNVYVSSFGNSDFQASETFVIVPASSTLSKDDPEFQEYASYLQGILVQKGFREATVPSAADFEVTLAYGISDGSTTLTGSNSSATAHAWRDNFAWSDHLRFNGHTSYIYDTTYQRTCQVAAYDLSAYRANGQMKPVWRTQMVSVGRSPDLRRVFPIMLAAGYGYLGLDSGTQQLITISETDPAVERVESTVKPPPLQ